MSLSGMVADSQTFKLIWRAADFLEFSAADSKALKALYGTLNTIYPQRLMNLLDALNQREESYFSKNIFMPTVILPLLYIVFISVSSFRISNYALLTIFLGLFFFFLGASTSRIRFNEIKFNSETKKIGILLYAFGIIFLTADLVVAGGIPLLNPALRGRLVVIYTMLAQLIPPGGILLISYYGEEYRREMLDLKSARIYAFGVFILTILLISTLGFRTQIIVTLFGSFVAMYFTGLVGFVEVMVSLIGAGLSVLFLGYFRAIAQGSPLGLLEVIRSRVGLTLSVYDYLIGRFMPFGANKGYTFLASFSSLIPGLPGPKFGPRTIVARLFEISGISVTSTMLGTVVLDFGLPGVIVFMFILGHVLGLAFKAAKGGYAMGVGIYSVLLAYALVGIETGIVDFNVLMMFLAGYLVLKNSPRKT